MTIKDDRKCASPVGNVCSLMTIMIRIHYLTFVEIFDSFNIGLVSKFKRRIKNTNESSLAMGRLNKIRPFVNSQRRTIHVTTVESIRRCRKGLTQTEKPFLLKKYSVFLEE